MLRKNEILSKEGNISARCKKVKVGKYDETE
jgi:hypothetical protein